MREYTDDKLLTAILANNAAEIKRLKKSGTTLTPTVKDALSADAGRKPTDSETFEKHCAIQYTFCKSTDKMKAEKFIAVMQNLRAELDAPIIYFSSIFKDASPSNIEEPSVLECVIECFDNKRINKRRLMCDYIDKDKSGLLAVCAEHGWLAQPKKRDEMIKYASDNNRTECAAWLLEFKNRTADLAAERVKAEKKMLRELNADPNSVTELKKIWSFEKTADGNIVIIGYKGDRNEITVPGSIGGVTVTAIGDYAFSPDAKRIRAAQRELRKSLTKITLPDTVERIGEFAFFKCRSLSQINLPERLTEISKGMLDITGMEEIVIGSNIKKIGAVAFYGCPGLKTVRICEGVAEIGEAAFYYCTGLETVELPRSIKKIPKNTMSESPFWACNKLTIMVHRGSYAEKYCKENNQNYKIMEK